MNMQTPIAPGTTITPDWNKIAETVTQMAVSKIPDVGPVLSGLIGLFWPQPSVSIWSEIEGQVEALVDQAIAQNNLLHMQEALQGIKLNLSNYKNMTVGSASAST